MEKHRPTPSAYRSTLTANKGWTMLEYTATAAAIVTVYAAFNGVFEAKMMEVAQEMNRQFQPIPGKGPGPTADSFVNNWGK